MSLSALADLFAQARATHELVKSLHRKVDNLERIMTANDDKLQAALDQLTAAFNAEKQQIATELQAATAAARAAQQADDQAEFDKATDRILDLAKQASQPSGFTPSGNVPAGS